MIHEEDKIGKGSETPAKELVVCFPNELFMGRSANSLQIRTRSRANWAHGNALASSRTCLGLGKLWTDGGSERGGPRLHSV